MSTLTGVAGAGYCREMGTVRTAGQVPLKLPDAAAVYGWRYRSLAALVPPAVVAPLALPGALAGVADLLPPRARR